MESYTWEDVLKLPGYFINMDRCPDRLEICMQRVTDAGFTNIKRYRAVDGTNEEELKEAWLRHGSPVFDESDTEFVHQYKAGKQGCSVTHYDIWKEMIEKEIPCAIIMEDDVEFHQRWHELAPRYWQATPKDFDVLYIGNQMDAPASGNIVIVPVYCTHAYIITLQGAKAFYDLCVKCPTGTRMMDCMINDSMRKSFETNGEHMPFTWYVWNASMFPDSNMYKRPDYWAIRNTGLVFQDAEFGSHVRPF